MADGEVPAERGEVLRIEHLRHQPCLFVHANGRPIGDGDTGGFLPAVLQRIQPEKRHARYIFIRRINADDAAFVLGFIRGWHSCLLVGRLFEPPRTRSTQSLCDFFVNLVSFVVQV